MEARLIDIFREMLNVDPVDIIPDPVPQPAFMGDECRCPDCTGDRSVSFLPEGGDHEPRL